MIGMLSVIKIPFLPLHKIEQKVILFAKGEKLSRGEFYQYDHQSHTNEDG
jgi:hypothetical protein